MSLKLNNERILVTGATGFVGVNLCERLKALGAKVYGLSKEEGSAGKKYYDRLIVADLADLDEIKKIIKKIKPSIIFHLGAYVVLERDYGTAAKCVDSNIKGTLNLLEAVGNSKDCHLVRHFVFASTEEVYGSGKTPFKEDQLLDAPSPYAISKVAGEQFSFLYSRLYGLPVTVVRFATMYGPTPPPYRLIPTIIMNALSGKEIPLNSGRKKRDYLYIEDAVSGLLKIIGSKDAVGEIINLSGAKSYSLKELTDLIVKLTKSKSSVRYNVFPDRVGEADYWLASTQKARKILKWSPEYSLIGGLKETIEYYKTIRR